ncbi:uncharacterized protein TrAtP1_005516 [Trichoderma atroviride]|uniref:uncharacterized protein n=1 Tax=Hypocrea atroviridis TaxID=63577 RepID=UPI003322F420|nr:hypothetical protein TrAtP1_005516 [Trichoderma atroviride]
MVQLQRGVLPASQGAETYENRAAQGPSLEAIRGGVCISVTPYEKPIYLRDNIQPRTSPNRHQYPFYYCHAILRHEVDKVAFP